jgi:hypothetical protein
LLHAALHISSFEFILPQKRNFTYNIIFPEMRFHTMIFAYRALLCMIINIYIKQFAFLKGIIVILTMISADYVTNYYKNKGYSNGTMMRNNAYSNGRLSKYVKQMNLFYAVCQIMATANMLFCKTERMFMTLFPIQIAPFLMTLEKKGIINQFHWHLYYTLSLICNFHWGFKYSISDNLFAIYWSSVAFVSIGRLYCNINKYILWFIPVTIGILVSSYT